MRTSASPGRMSAAACRSSTALLCCPRPCAPHIGPCRRPHDVVGEHSLQHPEKYDACTSTTRITGRARQAARVHCLSSVSRPTWCAAARLCRALTQRGCLGVLCRTSARCSTCRPGEYVRQVVLMAEPNTNGMVTSSHRLRSTIPCAVVHLQV